MVDFNESKDTYRSTIEDSINFIGQDLDFFVAVKAGLLKQTVKKLLPHLTKPRLLDIGCGHGYIHSHLSNDNFEIVGVEVASDVLELAEQANPDVTYISYNGEELPFEQSSFDIVMAICVMHHVPPSQWTSFLEEMKRVVKPGGIVIIFEHNPFNPLTRRVVANNILDRDAILLRNSKLENLMMQSGFKTAHTRYYLFTPFALNPIFRWLDNKLWWCPLGAQYYTVAML